MGITCPVNDPDPVTLEEVRQRFRKETTARLRWVKYVHVEYMLKLIDELIAESDGG